MKTEIRFYIDAINFISYFVPMDKKDFALTTIKNSIQHPEYGRSISLDINEMNPDFCLLPVASIKFISIVDVDHGDGQ